MPPPRGECPRAHLAALGIPPRELLFYPELMPGRLHLSGLRRG